MADKKTEEKKKKVSLMTTFDPDVLNDFKGVCKDINVSANIVLEAFMKQFVKGDLILAWDMKNGYYFQLKQEQE